MFFQADSQLIGERSQGIAVGMATSIPPHNLGEVIDGLVAMIDNPEITTKELMSHIKGPDFPTGAIILGREGIKEDMKLGAARSESGQKLKLSRCPTARPG